MSLASYEASALRPSADSKDNPPAKLTLEGKKVAQTGTSPHLCQEQRVKEEDNLRHATLLRPSPPKKERQMNVPLSLSVPREGLLCRSPLIPAQTRCWTPLLSERIESRERGKGVSFSRRKTGQGPGSTWENTERRRGWKRNRCGGGLATKVHETPQSDIVQKGRLTQVMASLTWPCIGACFFSNTIDLVPTLSTKNIFLVDTGRSS